MLQSQSLIQLILNEPDRLETLTPDAFEQLVQSTFVNLGWNVVSNVEYLHDSGFAAIAEIEGVNFKCAVRCVFHRNQRRKVGLQELRELKFLTVEGGFSKALLVTNTTLSEGVEVSIDPDSSIEVIDRPRLLEMMAAILKPRNRPRRDDCLSIVFRSFDYDFPEEHRKQIIMKLGAIFTRCEMSDENLIRIEDTQVGTLRELVRTLPNSEAAKIALWRVAESLRGLDLRISAAELDTFYELVAGDASSGTVEEWLEDRTASESQIRRFSSGWARSLTEPTRGKPR